MDEIKKRVATSLFLIAILTGMFLIDFAMVYFLIIISVLAFLEFAKMVKIIFKNIFWKINLYLIFFIYLFFFNFIFLSFTENILLSSFLIIVLFTCFTSDIAGFICGKIFKGPKLTKISPNKTFSGSFGSIIFSIIIYVSLIYLIFGVFKYSLIFNGFVISISVQIGDLLFSFLKRKSNLKNTGNLLPGHGGILDRIDGILFGVPVGLIIYILIK